MDEPTSREGGGPRTGVVLALTAAAAVLLAAAFVGWRSWRDDDGDSAVPATEVPGSGPETTVEDGDGGGEMLRRTTDAGIELRMQVTSFNGEAEILVANGVAVEPTASAVPDSTGGDEADDPLDLDGNGRPDFCDAVGDLMAWAITDDVVLQGNSPWTEGAIPELYPSAMFGGMLQPTFLAIVMQVGPDVRSVRLTSPAGAVDVMEPIGGAVALAVPAPDDDNDALPFEPGFFDGYQLIAEHGDGVVQRADWESVNQGHPAWGGPGPCMQGENGVFIEEVPASTMPVQELPKPGAEQPADAAAAQAEIEANFDSLYGNPVDGVDRSGVIDDASGLDVARQQVADNGFGDEAESATVTIHDLVFVSASEALFDYTLTTSAATFSDQFGRARLLDGVWKITRGTLCQDMEKAGATCPP